MHIEASADATHTSLPIVKLIHIELGKGTPFSALSYVWGTEIDSAPLSCDGGTIRITENLGQALRHLQIESEMRYLWIDALCIDQDNIAERNQQVTLMKDIYGTAKEVLVWLGPDPEGQADSIFDGIGMLLSRVMESFEMGLEPEHILSGRDLELIKKTIPVFRFDWFTRTWTIQEAGLAGTPTAVWGKSTIDLNKICLIGMLFLKCCKAVVEELGILHELQRVSNLYTTYLPLPGVKRLYYVLHEARKHKASDSRDKVYAFISHPAAFDDASDYVYKWRDQQSPEKVDDKLAQMRNLALILSPGPPIKDNNVMSASLLAEDHDHEMRPPPADFLSARRMLGWRSTSLHSLRRYHAGGTSFIKPDYNHSVVTVYCDFSRKIIERFESLEILSFVQHDGPLPATGPDFPSWVPRWDVDSGVAILGKVTCDHFAAANRKPIILPSPDPGELVVRGLLFDRVGRHTIPLKRSDLLDCSISPVFSMTTICQVHTNPVPDYPQMLNSIMRNPDRVAAYCKTWTGGNSSSFYGDDPDFLAYHQEFIEGKLRAGKCRAEELAVLLSLHERRAGAGDAKRFANAAAEACHGRCFFVTEAGFFGLGPSILEEKDIVCVLLGHDVPVILREKGKLRRGADGYVLIGECYVHGIMAGETIRAWGGPDGDLRDIKLS